MFGIVGFRYFGFRKVRFLDLWRFLDVIVFFLFCFEGGIIDLFRGVRDKI